MPNVRPGARGGLDRWPRIVVKAADEGEAA